jgi:hypothetical protein
MAYKLIDKNSTFNGVLLTELGAKELIRTLVCDTQKGKTIEDLDSYEIDYIELITGAMITREDW